MKTNVDLIVCRDESTKPLIEKIPFFSRDEKNVFWLTDLDDVVLLEKIIFSLARKPKQLDVHLRRIYYCLSNKMTDQLFAAIVDFLIILNGQGLSISWRVVLGTKDVLSESQFSVLNNYLKNITRNPASLSGNKYSIFSKGLNGSNNLVVLNDVTPQMDYDPLDLARDYIEFSQLEEAKSVLEKGVFANPLRMDLQNELLILYRSTQDSERFEKTLAKMVGIGVTISDEWKQLNTYFKGRVNDG